MIDLPQEPKAKETKKELKYLQKTSEDDNVYSIEQQRIFGENVSPIKTETHEKSTEDQSFVPYKLPSRNLSETGTKIKKLNTKVEAIKGPMLPASEIHAGIESYPGAISLLPLN